MDVTVKLRKTVAAVLFALILVTSISLYAVADDKNAAYDATIYGDVDEDGRITTTDARLLLLHCEETVTLVGAAFANADVNLDGRVNKTDAEILMEYLVGTVPYLPYGVDSETGIKFSNETFPYGGQRVTYNTPYKLGGTILSPSPILSVTITVTDFISGNTEASSTVRFSASDNLFAYHTRHSRPAIDNDIRFATLSTGKKAISVYCTSTTEKDVCLYTGTFRVGFTNSEVAGHVYDKSDNASSSEAKAVLNYLNTLDLTTRGGKLLSEGVGFLGNDYAVMDCSLFTQATYLQALNVVLPRTAAAQAEVCFENGSTIDFSELQAGDLVFWNSTACSCGRFREIHHVAIYIGYTNGKNYLIESSSGMGGVIIRGMWGFGGGVWQLDSYARP